MKLRATNLILVMFIAATCSVFTWGAAFASWTSYTSNHPTIINFQLSGGAVLNGDLAVRFDTGSQSEVWGNNIASRNVAELYVYAASNDKCYSGDTWRGYAWDDNVSYGGSTVATDPTTGGIGTYLDCSQSGYHYYHWYLENWGQDPAPYWQSTSNAWDTNG